MATKKKCQHDGSFGLRVGYEGNLWYTCHCGRYVQFTEREMLRMIRRRLAKQDEEDARHDDATQGTW